MDKLKNILNPKHLHWEFIGYISQENGHFTNAMTISVLDYQAEEEALNAAKEMAVRPNYYLQKVWECSTCKIQKEQLETIKKYLK